MKRSISSARCPCVSNHDSKSPLRSPTPKRPAAAFESFTSQLPVTAYKEEIVQLVRHNILTIITGETGSGKSTQIPQFLVDDPQLRRLLSRDTNTSSCFRLCITQPRRMAAIAMATRVAAERRCILGQEVGYSIRFDDHSDKKSTIIKYVTDGVALREILTMRGFRDYNIFIVDEAHERSLNTDVLFSLIKKAFQYKTSSEVPPIRFVIMSATLDVHKFSTFFDHSPVLSIPGRTFPVEVIYTPMTSYSSDPAAEKYSVPSSSTVVNAAVNAALRLHTMSPKDGGGEGHILVFLTGKSECDAACEAMHEALEALLKQTENNDDDRFIGDAIVIPLYGTLSSEDQALVFEPTRPGCRKIIFSTNVAETSLTVQDVEFVVDMGLVKQKSCNSKTGASILSVVWIAQSQAIQRTGRAGRCRSGKCFRVYSKEQFEQFLPTPLLEIHRENLSSTVLQLKALGLHDILHVEFIDPPSKKALLLSLKQLFYLQALNMDGELTHLGRLMVYFPLNPVYSRCLITSIRYNVMDQVLRIIAMLSVDNIWINTTRLSQDSDNPRNQQNVQRAQSVFKRFLHPRGDHLTLLNVFNAFMDTERRRWHSWCRHNLVVHRSLKQALDVYQQLRRLMSSKEFSDSFKEDKALLQPENTTDRILIALCQGFFVNVARLSCSSTLGARSSVLRTNDSRQGEVERFWVTLRDGQLVRYEPMTRHFPDVIGHSTQFDLVIFNDMLGYYRPGASTMEVSGFSISAIRIISSIQHEWIQPLIKRFNQLDIRRLVLRHHEQHPVCLPDADLIRPFNVPTPTDPTIPSVENSLRRKDEMVQNARQKYLERRRALQARTAK